MLFRKVTHAMALPKAARSKAFLIIHNWDDWLKFYTLHSLVIFDAEGVKHEVGGVKIGQFGMTDTQQRPDLPSEFTALSDEFFSLGQDDSYYVMLNSLGPEFRDSVLKSLRDVALDLDLFSRPWARKLRDTRSCGP